MINQAAAEKFYRVRAVTEGGRRMVEITPFGVLFVGSLCVGAVGVIVLAVLLFIAIAPWRNRRGSNT
jgi:hypothetical protein